jgi:hypothetical protein
MTRQCFHAGIDRCQHDVSMSCTGALHWRDHGRLSRSHSVTLNFRCYATTATKSMAYDGVSYFSVPMGSRSAWR